MDDFIRYQEVTQCWRVVDGELKLMDIAFTEDWSPERRRKKAAEILSGKYITYCAFDDDRVVGAILLIPELNKGRMIVDSYHVSADCRRMGIGRMLADAAKQEARNRGAHALYMSCCSSKETIAFYRAIGCQMSKDPIPEYAESEPCDLQMECPL